jgi:carboxyl-terminal processing protease
MKKIIFNAIGLLMLTNSAFASPAVELFNQAANYIETQYFGPSTVPIPALLEKYRTEVAVLCLRQTKPEECSYVQVEPLISKLFTDLQDGHAYYLTAEAVRQENANRQGQAITPRPALGLRFANFCETPNGTCEYDPENNLISQIIRDQLIIRVTIGSPAEAAGLRYGDRFIGYNNTLFSSFTDTTEYQKFRAELSPKVQAGESITLHILRGEKRERLDITLQGAIFNTSQMPQLEMRPDGIAILTVRDYQIRGVGQQIHNLIRQAENSGAKSIIYEQRQNAGGSVYEMMLAIGAFIPTPDSFRFVPRYNAQTNSIEFGYQTGIATVRQGNGVLQAGSSISNPIITRLPMVALVDSNCASGCEYFANYIKRHQRGTIIGAKTAGVGNSNTARFALANGGAAGIPTLRAFWLDGTGLPAYAQTDLQLPELEWTLFNTGRDQAMVLAINALKENPIPQTRASEALQPRASEALQTRASEALQTRASEALQTRASETLQLQFKQPKPLETTTE